MFTATATATASAAAARNQPAFTDLVAMPQAATFHFGRVARRYPAPAHAASAQIGEAAALPEHPQRHHGLMAVAAQLVARALAHAASALQRRAQQWSAARLRRLTERALLALDARTLHDIGLRRGELSSIAAEAAGEIEATRLRVWAGTGLRSF